MLSFTRSRRRQAAAFSLIEMLMVVSLISMLAAFSSSALHGFGSHGLTGGARTVAGMLTVARSEAIARHTLVRFAVSAPAEAERAGALRRVSLWAWDQSAEMFLPISKWEELPDGVAFEPQLPDYVRLSSYATKEVTTVQGLCVLGADAQATAEFVTGGAQDPVQARFIDFLPSGNLKLPGSQSRRAIYVLTEGFLSSNSTPALVYTSQSGGHPNNWTQINVDALTGRVRLYTP